MQGAEPESKYKLTKNDFFKKEKITDERKTRKKT